MPGYGISRGSILSSKPWLSWACPVFGEVVDPEIDIFDREAVFIERELKPLRQRHAGLKVVFEHINGEAVAYVENEGSNLAATITAIIFG